MMETQAVFSARISRVKVLGGFAAVLLLDPLLDPLLGPLMDPLLDPAAEPVVGGGVDSGVDSAAREDAGTAAAGRVGDALVVVGEVVAAEIVPGEEFPDDNVPAGDAFPGVSGRAEWEGCFAADMVAEAGAETGAGDGFEAAAGCDAAAGSP
jgi:hypothetical protein